MKTSFKKHADSSYASWPTNYKGPFFGSSSSTQQEAEAVLIREDAQRAQAAIIDARMLSQGNPLKQPSTRDQVFKPCSQALKAFRPDESLGRDAVAGFDLLRDPLSPTSLAGIGTSELNAVLEAAIEGCFSGLDESQPVNKRPCGIALLEATHRADMRLALPTPRFMIRNTTASMLDELDDTRLLALQKSPVPGGGSWPRRADRARWHDYRRSLIDKIEKNQPILPEADEPLSWGDYGRAAVVLLLPSLLYWLMDRGASRA